VNELEDVADATEATQGYDFEGAVEVSTYDKQDYDDTDDDDNDPEPAPAR
jgi:hypothetical protein